jgi:hypothetical protein
MVVDDSLTVGVNLAPCAKYQVLAKDASMRCASCRMSKHFDAA